MKVRCSTADGHVRNSQRLVQQGRKTWGSGRPRWRARGLELSLEELEERAKIGQRGKMQSLVYFRRKETEAGLWRERLIVCD